MGNRRTVMAAMAVLALIGAVYWPVVHAGFVWDDEIDFVKNDWLTNGDLWKQYIFRGFHGWTEYFRPLVVALFTVQLRLFDMSPGALHAVSLALHLANTTLVGLIAVRCSRTTPRPPTTHAALVTACMLVYGLHGANIEPVAWIASQFDLFATFFMLLGLLASQSLQGRFVKPATIAACFFLAGCSKESAAVFPLILAIFDWAMAARKQGGGVATVRAFAVQNATTYMAVIAAGCAYLAFRSWALGAGTLPELTAGSTWFGNFQVSAYTYLRYWTMLFAPAMGMNPLHPFDPASFEVATPASLARDAAAAAMILAALWFAIRRRSAAACMVLVLTCSLLPVLYAKPTNFDGELYHDRYLMTGLACLCAMAPLLCLPTMPKQLPSLRLAAGALALAWCLSSILTIRATLPLWANSVALWQWALGNDPTSARAANALMIAYLDRGGLAEARKLGDWVMRNDLPCANCLLDIATVALQDGDTNRARAALAKAPNFEREILANWVLRKKYLDLMERLRRDELQANPPGTTSPPG